MYHNDALHESWNDSAAETQESNRFFRFCRWLIAYLRPALGWWVLLCCVMLAWWPGETAHQNEWLDIGRRGPTVEPLGPLSVLLVWLILGWRRNSTRAGWRSPRAVTLWLLFLAAGAISVSQAVTGWLPGPWRLFQAMWNENWVGLFNQMQLDLSSLFVRLSRWQQGVWAGGAIQDDAIFVFFTGIMVWLVGGLVAWLARRYERGFLAALPALWLVGVASMYGTVGRTPIIMTLILATALHLLLDQHARTLRWQRTGLDYNPAIFVDQAIYVLAASALIFSLAGLMPNLMVRPVADRYYRLYAPINTQVEALGERLFPDLKATSRFRTGALATGLPNNFLLSGGPELSLTEVMRVRTDEPIIDYDPIDFYEIPAPPGHYIRGGILSSYDGLGWRNPLGLSRVERAGDDTLYTTQIYTLTLQAQAEDPVGQDAKDKLAILGRKLLKQDIFLTFNSLAIYAAPEPVRPAVAYRIEESAAGDPVALWANTPNRRVNSYSIVSAIPAVSSNMLAAEPAFSRDELPAGYELYLELPDTVTQRTRDLAQEITADLDSPFAKADAIETFLRQYEYDLSVAKPPDSVTDVADYFLFDLQRGYCDYYATAFVVLARLSGLPTRFATGFSPGLWNAAENTFVITEAEAHSWPEVYFPTYGWIPFEPTAGRPLLTRASLISTSSSGASLPVAPIGPPEVPQSSRFVWNWQMLFWLLPLALLAWGGYHLLERWRIQREDPWQGVLNWGRRVGRPIVAGETVLEYGAGLADYTRQKQQYKHDMGRMIAREVEAMSQDVSTVQYGAEHTRAAALQQALERWHLLRGYLRRFRI